jgi:hypothetical protein
MVGLFVVGLVVGLLLVGCWVSVAVGRSVGYAVGCVVKRGGNEMNIQCTLLPTSQRKSLTY